jgi:hypothetical protein
VLPTGTNALSLVFSPSDATDYSSQAASVTLVVLPAPLTITANNAARLYGAANPVFTGTLTGVQNGDNITAAYTCSAGPTSAAGAYPIVPAPVSPGNLQTNYQVTLVDGTLTVTPATPTVTWTNPAPITYGTALSAVQLNATASVPGTELYTPPVGTVLPTGTNILSLVFSPADATDYGSQAASVSLVVLPAPLIITANNATRPYGATNPVFTGTITGLQNGDNISATYTCSAGLTTAPGAYLIAPAPVSPGNLQTNYQVTLVDGTLTIFGPPLLQVVTESNGTITLNWNATAGQSYQVQYTTALNPPDWTNLVIITATSSTATVSDALSSSTQRFYRIVWLP